MSESRYVFDNAAERQTRERFAALPRIYDPGTVHLPEREAILARLAAALKPGGWLLVEESDSLSMRPDPTLNPTERRPRLYDSLYRVMAERGVNVRLGLLFDRVSLQAGESHHQLVKLRKKNMADTF